MNIKVLSSSSIKGTACPTATTWKLLYIKIINLNRNCVGRREQQLILFWEQTFTVATQSCFVHRSNRLLQLPTGGTKYPSRTLSFAQMHARILKRTHFDHNAGHRLNLRDAWKMVKMRDCPAQSGTSGHPTWEWSQWWCCPGGDFAAYICIVSWDDCWVCESRDIRRNPGYTQIHVLLLTTLRFGELTSVSGEDN